VGRPVNWIIDYNKLGPPNLSGQYDFYYQGYALGVDRVGETLDVFIKKVDTSTGKIYLTMSDERVTAEV
jgi:transcriptional accessory protein Tex/SPT6